MGELRKRENPERPPTGEIEVVQSFHEKRGEWPQRDYEEGVKDGPAGQRVDVVVLGSRSKLHPNSHDQHVDQYKAKDAEPKFLPTDAAIPGQKKPNES